MVRQENLMHSAARKLEDIEPEMAILDPAMLVPAAARASRKRCRANAIDRLEYGLARPRTRCGLPCIY